MLRPNNHQLYYGQTHLLHHNGDIGYNDIKMNSSDIKTIEEVLLSLKSAYWSGTYSEVTEQTAGSRIIDFSENANISGFTNSSGVITVPFSSVWSISIYAETQFSTNSVTKGSVEYQVWRNGAFDTIFIPLTHFDVGQIGQDRVTVSSTRIWEMVINEGDNVHIQQVIPAGVQTDEMRIELNIKGNNINAKTLLL